MPGLLAYRILCGAVGSLLLLFGLAMFASFFGYHMPGGSSPAPFRLGPDGAYFMAFTGCGMIVWGGCLLASAREPRAAPFIASISALGLVLMALYRMTAWIIGDYQGIEGLLRQEAAVMLALSLAFVWLRPQVAPAKGELDTQGSQRK